jgi:hypothetical protein
MYIKVNSLMLYLLNAFRVSWISIFSVSISPQSIAIKMVSDLDVTCSPSDLDRNIVMTAFLKRLLTLFCQVWAPESYPLEKL